MIDAAILFAAEQRMIERYSNRLASFGADPRTLGWDCRESQEIRFAAAARSVTFHQRSVLDIGCGLGDFLGYLRARPEMAPASYLGVDINPDLIGLCRDRCPDADFEVGSLLRMPEDGPQWDIVTLFGLLNLRFDDISNAEYSRTMIERAFSLTRSALVVDMLSTVKDPAYPEESFVYYHDPSQMLELALSLTPRVRLLHDYPSIPQREFMLVLERSDGEFVP